MKSILSIGFCCSILWANCQNVIAWSNASEISSMAMYGNNFPRIVMDGSGNPMVIWNNSSNLYFSKWTATSFSAPIQLNPIGSNIAGANWMGPDIASKGDTVYVVYKNSPENDTSSHIWCIRSFDGGLTFNSPVRVDYIANNYARFPTVSVNNSGNAIIGFMEFNASFTDPKWVVTKSMDFGNTFSLPVSASGWSGANSEVCDCCPSKIISNGSYVALPYRDNFGNIRDTWCGISLDGGNTFAHGIDLDQLNWSIMACPSSGPDGVIVGDTLITTYMSGASGSNLVYYNKSSLLSNLGTSAIPLDQITPVSLNSQNFPRVDYNLGSLVFAWKQVSGGVQELAVQFTENAMIGMNPTQEIIDQNYVGGVDVALSNGQVWVIWEDENSGTVKFKKGNYNSQTNLVQKNQVTVKAIPNPSSDQWVISGDEINNNTMVELTTINGNHIQNMCIHNGESIIINNTLLTSGIYFATVTTEAGKITLRLMKD
jgi:hypothetical protein